MFAWVGTQFDAVLNTYVLGVVTALMAGIAPIALTAMTIWVTLYGWAVLRNEVSETVPTFLWKVFKIGLVLAFALQSGFYISNVSDSANALATGVATTFLPAAADPMAITSPYVLLDSRQGSKTAAGRKRSPRERADLDGENDVVAWVDTASPPHTRKLGLNSVDRQPGVGDKSRGRSNASEWRAVSAFEGFNRECDGQDPTFYGSLQQGSGRPRAQ